MPRYGDVDSLKWFDVETSNMFHIFNCFEDGQEVTNNKGYILLLLISFFSFFLFWLISQYINSTHKN